MLFKYVTRYINGSMSEMFIVNLFQFEDESKQIVSELRDADHKLSEEKRRQAKAMREKRDERLKQKTDTISGRVGNKIKSTI